MLTEFIQAALKRAEYETLPDSGEVYGEIEACPGVWAKAGNFEDCRAELAEVLEAWVLVRVARGLEIPVIDGHTVLVREAS